MVEKKLENEVVEIIEKIKNNNDFLLSGGAGSGKTYSLIQLINHILETEKSCNILCITYTNSAVDEIKRRVDSNRVNVSTIHDFLWDTIKLFQKELKEAIIYLINDENSKLKYDGDVTSEFYDELKSEIKYKEYLKLKDGIISHDELIEVSKYMFGKYKLLSDITKDKYKYIFIDEYQDTMPDVIEIFIKYLEKSLKKNVIGFFGDSMQAIYPYGIGDLSQYVSTGRIKEIVKNVNRRNPKSIIDLANKLRSDNVIQEPSDDLNAPNMEEGQIIEGNIKFLYSTDDSIKKVKETKYLKHWNWEDGRKTKELYLTHNLIALKADFQELINIYDKDPIISFKNDVWKVIKQENISTENLKFNDVISTVSTINKSILDKFNKIKEDAEKNILYSMIENEKFDNIRNIYLDKESLLDDKKDNTEDNGRPNSKRDNLIKHLFKIQGLIELYNKNQLNEFVRKSEYKIKKIVDKKKLKQYIEELTNKLNEKTIEDVINYTNDKKLCLIDDKLDIFIKNNKYVYERVKILKYSQFVNLYYYLEGYTPFSTQHKIKGEEYENVFIIMDNGKWNNYNFEYLFANPVGKDTVIKRTQKLFYVCCTRTKTNLCMFVNNPSNGIINKAKEWFGEANVINLDITN